MTIENKDINIYMFNKIKQFFSFTNKKEGIAFLKGSLISGVSVLFILFSLQMFKTFSVQKHPIQNPPKELVKLLGKTNVTIYKFPLNVWHVDTREQLIKVENLLENKILELGAGTFEPKIGSYVLFFANSSNNSLGYVVEAAIIESTYIIKK
jgi:hypothetical protein